MKMLIIISMLLLTACSNSQRKEEVVQKSETIPLTLSSTPIRKEENNVKKVYTTKNQKSIVKAKEMKYVEYIFDKK